ncbi:MAG TPA: glutathione S-transferase C-terminal domain-containing protein [Leptolyngbyaceae cyanobacterium M65_K2018_010]|nr:glutathione S-transferase C-terminal domain-containing protein [Leptolyngbyaceae cyanobacterium M65_K2018_010]
MMIRTAKGLWTTLWQRMMAQLAPADPTGHYQRPTSQFRDWIQPESPHPPAPHRYSLIVGMGCPWAHRTLLTRALKGLEEVISLIPVVPSPDQGCWAFTTSFRGCHTLPELYRQAQPGYSGRATVPVLWDRQTASPVNNESADIILMLNQAFNGLATQPQLDLYPEPLQADIDAWNDRIYATVNNGVYRCGFAQTQAAYDQACAELFDTLAAMEAVLTTQPYLCGEAITLADVRLFPTLFRFDAVYYGLFKCNLRRIQDYPALSRYLRAIYRLPRVAATCDLAAVKRDYYGNLFPLNPGGIIPAGPDLPFLRDDPGELG